jgi:hypothetical protein
MGTVAEEARDLSVPMQRVLYAAMLGGVSYPHYATRNLLAGKGLIHSVKEEDGAIYWHATELGIEVGEASLDRTNELRKKVGQPPLSLEGAWRVLEMAQDELQGHRG